MLALAALLLLGGSWLLFTENAPEAERELRVQTQERLETWFPEAMSLPEELQGFQPRSQQFSAEQPPQVLMLHGLDEPGGIFDELAAALDARGINGWEFRYPNDQAIDASADLLAEHWAGLPTDHSIILLGHSMGGLVIRDFVSRWRHPADQAPQVLGPTVRGVILVGTPNQGSDWVRLRVWLELRDLATEIAAGRFSLFAGLRDGTGAAKIDLRPDSAFLNELNARAWPETVPIRIIGGLIEEATAAMRENLTALAEDLADEEAAESLDRWWQEAGEQIGDGVVPVDSLAFEPAPEPLLVPASHRGLLVTLLADSDPPPAIEPIIGWIEEWLAEAPQPD